MPAPPVHPAGHERMSSVDYAWLRMDRPGNLMQIIGVMIFDGRMDFERLRRTVVQRLLRYRRFRQIAEAGDGAACWRNDPDFDIDAHLRRAVLPPPGDQAALRKFLAGLASEPLNPARPRWEFILVETAGDSALIARFHHAIADGIALAGVMDALTDTLPETAAPPPPDPLPAEEPDPFGSRHLTALTEAALAPLRTGSALWRAYLDLLADPARIVGHWQTAGSLAGELARLALMPDDTRTRFKGTPGTHKCVAWSAPISLPEVKAVGRVLGCSVNDMLLASAAGAFHGYLREKGDAVAADSELRALVPVNLRTAADAGELGNRFGLVALELPIGIENPLARLYATRTRMERLKESRQAWLTYGIIGVAGQLPAPLQNRVLDLLAGKATAVMTNVPGPQGPRWLAGARLRQQMFWVPQSGDIGIGVSILSYDGQVQFGLITDKGLVDDPERIVARFANEFEKLLWLVLLEPDERLGDPASVEAAVRETLVGDTAAD